MSTRRPVAPDPGIHPSRSGGFARAAFQIGFWIPLLFCTWAALVPAPPDNPVFQLSDVLLHAAAFTYLSFAFVLAWLEGGSGPAYLRAFLCMLGYGVLLEVVQSFIPERSAEFKDLLVDAAGIGAGLLLAAWLARPLYDGALRLSARL
ncbi:MAG TPA: VanZ family protein [Pseudomonadales bacterium]